jgi:hypothetical protein
VSVLFDGRVGLLLRIINSFLCLSEPCIYKAFLKNKYLSFDAKNVVT